ncbi:MAG: YncE family protein [Bryobacteraceae bacterium]
MTRAMWFFILCSAVWGQSAALLIVQRGSGSLGIYDLAGNPLAAIPIGGYPHEMDLSPDGRFAYTTDSGPMPTEGPGGNAVAIIDLTARKKAGEIPLEKFLRPHGIDVDIVTGRVYVSTEWPDQLLALDPKTRKIVRTYETKGRTSHMVTLGPGGKFAYVSNSGSNNVAAIDLASRNVTLIATGKRPEGSALSKDGTRLYVACRDEDTISILDTVRNVPAGEIKTGKGPSRIALTPMTGQLVYALGSGAVEIADPASRKVVGYVTLEQKPAALMLSRDGRLAFASAKDRVYVISVAERKVVREIKLPAGSGPDTVVETSLP